MTMRIISRHDIYVEFPADLRMSLDVKMNSASKLTNWTAWVNNAGTLCHVVNPTADVLIRVKFKDGVKTYTTTRISYILTKRLENWVIL